VAIWWALFSLPLALFVKEPEGERVTLMRSVRGGYENLIMTFRKLRSLKSVSLFLVAYWLYIDGVDTIIRMAVDYGISIGLDASDLILALLIVQFVGFPATLLFGKLSRVVPTKTLILAAIGVYLFVTLWAAFIDASRDFFILALLIGLVQGGIQALSRSFYSRIIPRKNAAEFFGFYNLLGKFAAIIGPALIGMTALLTESTRVGIASIIILFIAGGWMLLKVDEVRGIDEAKRFEQG
jgi:UMF1 family MFS transporter